MRQKILDFLFWLVRDHDGNSGTHWREPECSDCFAQQSHIRLDGSWCCPYRDLNVVFGIYAQKIQTLHIIVIIIVIAVIMVLDAAKNGWVLDVVVRERA